MLEDVLRGLLSPAGSLDGVYVCGRHIVRGAIVDPGCQRGSFITVRSVDCWLRIASISAVRRDFDIHLLLS